MTLIKIKESEQECLLVKNMSFLTKAYKESCGWGHLPWIGSCASIVVYDI